MKTIIDLFRPLTLKAKSAFMLFFAKENISALKDDPLIYNSFIEGFDAGWQWIEGENILYEVYYKKHVKDLSIHITRYITDKEKDNAFFIALKSLYFVSLAIGQIQSQNNIPAYDSDVVELEDEETLLELLINWDLEFNLDVKVRLVWIEKILKKLSQEYNISNKNETASPITKEYFEQFLK